MAERLAHQRSKGPASTPAQRLVELQNALAHSERLLNESEEKREQLALQLARYHTFHGVSFAGVPVAQHWCDFVLWEAILNDNPQLRAIFEIGTWQGGFSWWLFAQAQARGISFRSYDAVVPSRAMEAAVEGSFGWSFFVKADVFALADVLGPAFAEQEPCVVFCDGGNKPRELKTFSAYLRSRDSLLVAHDWGTEFLPDDVPDTVEMVYGDFCEELGSITRVFRIKDA